MRLFNNSAAELLKIEGHGVTEKENKKTNFPFVFLSLIRIFARYN